MSSYGKFWKVDGGETVLKSGESHDSLYILLKGTLEVVRENDQALLAILEPGESFGEMRILDNAQAEASATVRANTKAAVWQMERQQFDTFIERHPQAAVVLVRSLATTVVRRLRETTEKVAGADPSHETPGRKSGWFWR
ncbi:MAG: cyclic nucleotide-binding domain-containing protein [Verrucomicrobiota bacterium]